MIRSGAKYGLEFGKVYTLSLMGVGMPSSRHKKWKLRRHKKVHE